VAITDGNPQPRQAPPPPARDSRGLNGPTAVRPPNPGRGPRTAGPSRNSCATASRRNGHEAEASAYQAWRSHARSGYLSRSSRLPALDNSSSDTSLVLVVLLDGDAATSAYCSIRRRATVSAFAEDRLEAERTSGVPAAALASWYERQAAVPLSDLCGSAVVGADEAGGPPQWSAIRAPPLT